MEIFFSVFIQMIKIVILMLVGYIANKCKVLDDKANKYISSLVLNITTPALIMTAISEDVYNNMKKIEVLKIIFFVIFMFIVFIFLSEIISRVFNIKENVKEIKAMFVFPNMGFMGIPVISGIYGTEKIINVTLSLLVFNLVFYSYGYLVLSKDGMNLKKLINPGVVTGLISICLFMIDIRLPKIIYDPLSMVGGVTSTLAMIVIGSTIATINIKNALFNLKIYFYSFVRLLLYPLIFYFLVQNIFIFKMFNKEMINIIVILSAMPTAANVVMSATDNGLNAKLISEEVFLTQMFVVITVPIIAMLIN